MNTEESMYIHYSVTSKDQIWYSYAVFNHIIVIQNYSYAVFNSPWPSYIQYSIQYSTNQNTRYSVCNSVCSLTIHWVFSMQCDIQWIVILVSKLQISRAAALHFSGNWIQKIQAEFWRRTGCAKGSKAAEIVCILEKDVVTRHCNTCQTIYNLFRDLISNYWWFL